MSELNAVAARLVGSSLGLLGLLFLLLSSLKEHGSNGLLNQRNKQKKNEIQDDGKDRFIRAICWFCLFIGANDRKQRDDWTNEFL